MANVDPQEVPYWRDNYGIHLVSYISAPEASPEVAHAELLTTLDCVAASLDGDISHQVLPVVYTTADRELSLLRHAKRVQTLAPPSPHDAIPLRAEPRGAGYQRHLRDFYRTSATEALRVFRAKVALTGPPGAGKSFAVRMAAAGLAEVLIENLLRSDHPDVGVVPTYVDMKLYEGDLWGMALSSFTIGVPVAELVAQGAVAFFIDGINEVPARFDEDGALVADLAKFLAHAGTCSVVLVTRFGDELAGLDLPEVVLDEIDWPYLEAHLPDFGLSEPPPEIVALLRRPLFYRLLHGSPLSADIRSPHAIYAAVVKRVAAECSADVEVEVDLMQLFGPLAFDCVGRGQQLILLGDVVRQIKAVYGDSIDALQLVDRLIGESFLAPNASQRVSLFHHSVTEYLASYRLAQLYAMEHGILGRCLASVQWNHAILLSLGFLPAESRRPFLTEVIRAAPALAVRALAFLDDRDRWAPAILDRLATLEVLGFEDEVDVGHEFERLQFEKAHEALLAKVADRNDMLGGVALAKIVEVLGKEAVRRCLDRILDPDTDFNFKTAAGRSIAELVTRADLEYLAERLGAVEVASEDVWAWRHGEESRGTGDLTSGAAAVLGDTTPDDLESWIGPIREAPVLVRAAVLSQLTDSLSGSHLRLALDLLETDTAQAVVATYFQLEYGKDTRLEDADIQQVGPKLLEALGGEVGDWAVGVLHAAGAQSSRWREWILSQAELLPVGVARAALHYAGGEAESYFAVLHDLARSDIDWTREPVGVLRMCEDVSWNGRAGLLVRLLRLRVPALATALIERLVTFSGDDDWETEVELDDLAWWVAWLVELDVSSDDDADMLVDRLGRFIAQSIGASRVDDLVTCFRQSSDEPRRVVAAQIMAHLPAGRLESLDASDVSWALADLRRDPPSSGGVRLLGHFASETFMETTVVPMLLETPAEPLRSNLLKVALEAGRRHGRRYVSPTGVVVG
jgi:hypothetical protein